MLVQRAEEFARLVHRNQFYGELPYVDHLKEVYLTLLDFGVRDETILAASWLHDSIEDTETTYETLEIQFGKEVADLVLAVTNEKGTNRKDILERTAPKIKDNEKALILKLADRIVNTEFSIDNNEKLYKMYEKEFPRFKTLLFKEDEKNEIVLKLWEHLSNLYNPWIILAGKYENDPQYDEVLAYIEEYRRELDEEVGRYYDDCYEIVEERMYDL
jgi:(p)ppGpp synthase/HD superfamily hydrolase